MSRCDQADFAPAQLCSPRANTNLSAQDALRELHVATNGDRGWRIGREHEGNVELIKSETLVGIGSDGSQPRFWS